MQELDILLAGWRQSMAQSQLATDALDELEGHVRETAESLITGGASPAEAFSQAVMRFGDERRVSAEFEKIREREWLPIRLISWLGVLIAIMLFLIFSRGIYSGRFGLLLASHVVLVTLGYTTTILIGALGFCYVVQRSFRDLSSGCLEHLRRSAGKLGTFAAVLTAGGVLLGMIWAKINWGRYWDWDAKEIGGMAVLTWQIVFLLALRATARKSHAPILATLLGNLVVLGAWFGTNLISALHQYGTAASFGVYLLVVVANLIVLAVGLGPANWLRSRPDR